MDDYVIEDPRFAAFIAGNARVKRLADGFDWTEGPVWFGDADHLLFSDIPNDRILRWSPTSGLSTWRCPANFANGHTRDRQGRLISCEHGARRVTRTELDGSITVIADSYDGKRLNAPNDVAVKSDGTIWFSDPVYGIFSHYEGHKAEAELPCHVYRVDPVRGRIEAVLTDFECPNGLCFSPDERRLYVAETGWPGQLERLSHIRAFDVDESGGLSGGDIFHSIDPGKADGMRCDTDGNLWSSAGDGVHCLSPQGERLGKVLVPERVSNLCFGGRGWHKLFMTATTGLYAVSLNREGAQVP